jgi:predicted Zn-dependent protease
LIPPRAAALLLCVAAAACAVNPATGRRELALVGAAQEIEMGRDGDRDVVASLGTYPDEALARYVQDVGQRLAAVSERPDLEWTFRVIDDPTVNAFALPGGFLYVTRGILAHLTSEAELAAVLGHEIGHVTARHSVSQISRAQLAQLGLGVGVALGGDTGRALGGIASQGVSLMFLKFGRDDERQADDLGLRYVLASGYDPRPMPDVFQMLARVSASSESGKVPGWLSTHPAPENRRATIEAAIAASGKDLTGRAVGRAPFHARVDGIVFGDDPREGYFIEPNRFVHPTMEFQLDLPSGWKTRNTKQQVAAGSPEQDAVVRLSLAKEATPAAALDGFLKQEGVLGGAAWRTSVGNAPAASREFSLTSGTDRIDGIVAYVAHRDRVLSLTGFAKAGAWPARRAAVEASIASFRKLTDPKALAVEPERIVVVQAGGSETVADLGRRNRSTAPPATLALINQVQETDRLSPGAEYKIVRGGRRP